MVYLGGDNNLDAETYDKLVQIKNGWQDETDGKIIVYQDTPFKDSPRLMEIDGKSEKGYITIHTYDQENSACLYLSDGREYHNGDGFLRMNLACPMETLKDGLSRLKASIRAYCEK